MNNNSDLLEALSVARAMEKRPSWAVRQWNKAKVLAILQDEKNNMDRVSSMVNAYNNYYIPRGYDGYNAQNLDNFYHKRAMYRAAQLGADAAEFAYWAGQQKEKYDKYKKYLTTRQTMEQIDADSKKDLQNNKNAIIMALQNPGVPVDKMIPHEGTTAGTFDIRFLKRWQKQ